MGKRLKVWDYSLMLGRSLIKWKQRPGMTIAVDRDIQQQIQQTILGPCSPLALPSLSGNLQCASTIFQY